MTLKQIIQKYLEENNFAGLCSGECGCSKDDLFPCGEPIDDCQAALWMPCCDCDTPDDCQCPEGAPDGCFIVPVKYGGGMEKFNRKIIKKALKRHRVRRLYHCDWCRYGFGFLFPKCVNQPCNNMNKFQPRLKCK